MAKKIKINAYHDLRHSLRDALEYEGSAFRPKKTLFLPNRWGCSESQ